MTGEEVLVLYRASLEIMSLRAVVCLCVCACQVQSVAFGKEEGDVTRLANTNLESESEILDDVAKQLVRTLSSLPGVDSGDKTQTSINKVVVWMKKRGMLACPAVANVLEKQLPDVQGSAKQIGQKRVQITQHCQGDLQNWHPKVSPHAFRKTWSKSAKQDSKGVFILAAHVKTRHQGHLLVLTLFSIWKHHPGSSVVVVDNASPVPMQKALPKVFFDKHKEKFLVVREEVSRYEFGAYNRGLKFLAESKGKWALANFKRFYYMQAQIYLNQPVPQHIPFGCQMMPMMAGPGPPGDVKGKTLVTEYLSSHGLMDPPLNSLPTEGDHGTSHTSFVSDLAGAKLLIKTQALSGNFTHKVTAIFCEGMLGVIINRLMQQSLKIKTCGQASLGWDQKKGAFWTKLHGSGKGGFSKSDTMALAELLRFADHDMDGRTSVEEFSSQIVAHPARFEQTWQSMCMMLPLINVEWVRSTLQQRRDDWHIPSKKAVDRAEVAAASGNFNTNQPFTGLCNPAAALFWAREGSNALNMEGYQ